MRIAMFVGSFPLVSETFITNQITGLMDLGHAIYIYAERRPSEGNPIHHQVVKYGLLRRTTYIDMPPEAGYWEMPVTPLSGRTWIPGTDISTSNLTRVMRAVPSLVRSLVRAPRLTFEALDPSVYGYQASSLSALYRLAALCSQRRMPRGRDKARPYDVLHAHFGPVGNSFRFARELWDAPMLVSFHGYDFSAWPRKRDSDVYARLFSTIDGVTVNSEHTTRRLEELGCPSRKLYKLPMGLDLASFQFHERTYNAGEPVRLLTVGRLVEKKGIEYSIRAVAQLLEKRPELRYNIVGDGPLRPALEELIKQLGLGDRVTLRGALDSNRVRQLMDEAHIFVLASVTASDGDQEGQGLVLQEAQASGMPVVATDHNGFSESIVPGESGFLVPERDSKSLAEQLDYLIEHAESWPLMGRKGREHVEAHYDARKLSRRLASIYEDLIETFQETRGDMAGRKA